MDSRIRELFTYSTRHSQSDWQDVINAQHCAYIARKCLKVRKSQPEVSIGVCTVEHGASNARPVIVCPQRFLESSQIFIDCLHLLTRHEPGNELHKIPEVAIPGGSVDYVLASVRQGVVVDFVGLEIQAVDTTGTTWPARQAFLQTVGLIPAEGELASKPYGLNWKMTAKTILVQLHHKAETFELINKKLVLVAQNSLYHYMERSFRFSHLTEARPADSLHFHLYTIDETATALRLRLSSRKSTNADGIAHALGLQANPKVELEVILNTLQGKLSDRTRLSI